CGLKAIRLQEIEGQIVATAFDYVEHPKILSQPDADPDQLTREALDKFLSRNSLRGDIVAISVPGQSGLARFVKLPPVEEKKIADIVRFEAKQQIPFNLDEVVWDYQKIGSGTVTDGFAMETEIGLFAMKRDMVGRYLQHFKDVNVDVHLVQMAPLALCNYVAYDLLAKDAGGAESGEKKCIVALDIGADSSNLVITDGERIIWQRPIPLGGNHFTRALTKDLKLTFAKAEHLKRNATKSPDLKKILAALKPVLNDFVGEVQRSLGYFTNTHRDAHIEYMIGLGNAFRLPGLQKFLGEKLQLEVKKVTKMERVGGDQVVAQQAYTENVLTFAVAYGLALQGLKQARLQTNLLPHEIRVERLVKAKKPFAVAAAAALLLAGGGLALGYALEYRTYNDKRVTDAMKSSKSVVDKAKSAETKYKSTKKKAQDEEEAVKTIVAGQFERDNWPQLYKFINTALPQPDGSDRQFVIPSDDFDEEEPETITRPNIPDDQKEKYWNQSVSQSKGAMSGKEANKEYLKRRLSGGVKEDSANGSVELGAGIEDLIQVNIESVNSFFCDDLNAFWDEAKKSQRLKNLGETLVRPKTDFSKNPSGSGWIIEIQGWTYHRDLDVFIRNTFLENLAQLGIHNPKPKTDAAAGGDTPDGKTAPAAPAAPARAPVPPPAPAPGKPGQPAENEPLPDYGPVINHISHVVLYQYTQSTPKAEFALLDKQGQMDQDVRALALAKPVTADQSGTGGLPGSPGGGMAGGAQGGAAGGVPAMGSPGQGPGAAGGAPGMAGAGVGGGPPGERGGSIVPTRDSWEPLGSSAGGAGAGREGGLGGMFGRRAGFEGRFGGRGGAPRERGPKQRRTPLPGGTPPLPGQIGNPQKPEPEVPQTGPKRTEFIILLVWKEPTPSDDLRGLSAAAADGANNPTASPRPSDNKQSTPPPRSRRGRGGRGGRRGR
ncbi:MAG TPA: type IV pilus assembly protein PilM, partial [Gemmataceae bacterium]